MDFLVLFFFYLALLLTGGVLICICSRSQYLKGLVGKGAQIISRLIPECLQRPVQRLLHYLFHSRNPTFIVLHLVLQGLVYTEFTWEIFGYCRELDFAVPYLLLPYLLLFVNLLFFALSCGSNPGTITKANELLLLQVYKFDEVMFPKNVRCPTCDLRKPARSKHCRVCNRCVHRFDHHCVWVNNCIGAWNARYFLIYLTTLTASAATIATLSAAFLVQVVFFSDLYLETYIDDRGHSRVVDIVFLVQDLILGYIYISPVSGSDLWSVGQTAMLYLFLLFPRIIFLLGFVVVLSFLLGGYLCFALYLAATNQTTNEWYRAGRAPGQHCCHQAPPSSTTPQIFRNIHSHGIWSNLQEIFLPATCYKKKKK